MTHNQSYQTLGAAELLRMYQTTKHQIAIARKMAASGKRSEAFGWWRFITGCETIRVLNSVDWSAMKPVTGDVALLAYELDQLRQECGDDAKPDLVGVLNKIDSTLEIIAQGVQMMLQKNGGVQ